MILNLARSFEIICYEFLNILSNPLVGKSQPLCLQAAVLNRESVRPQGLLSFLILVFLKHCCAFFFEVVCTATH